MPTSASMPPAGVPPASPSAKLPLPPPAKLPLPPPEGSCVWPLSADLLAGVGLPSDAVSVVELDGDRLLALVSGYVMKQGRVGGVPSFKLQEHHGADDSDEECEEGGCGCGGERKLHHTTLALGVGAHAFQHAGETLWVVRQRRGEPVGTNGGPEIHTSALLVAAGAGREHELAALCDALVAKAEAHVENTYHIFQWNVEHGYWRHQGVRAARPVESVVLPKEAKESVVGDIEEFLSKETKRFYTKHGIPYKRSYLFWGVPGTGKTSLIQALAGKFHRRICFMQPTDPKFTDDMLKRAITTAPHKSMIIFEDIDALFTKQRENRGKSAVTFSGLLNALDGVGMTEGQVFCLTTNFREQLDAALIRNGRVDVHVEFKHLADEQSAEMFRRFFPGHAELADEFVAKLHSVLGSRADTLTPALLQNFFTHERKAAGPDVIARVDRILEEMKRREAESTSESAKKDEKADDDDEDGGKKKKGVAGECLKPTHHWHISFSTTVALTVIASVCIPVLVSKRGQ